MLMDFGHSGLNGKLLGLVVLVGTLGSMWEYREDRAMR